MIKIRLTILLFFVAVICYSQADISHDIRSTLDSLSISSIPQLNDSVDISLTGIGLAEFVRSVSNHVGLNINVDPSLNFQVNNNYSHVTAKDLLYMLCAEYNLDMKVYGSIINLKPRFVDHRKKIIDYNGAKDELSFELANCSLSEFTKALASQSPYNFFLTGDIGSMTVSGYSNSLNALDALNGLAESNNFVLRKEKEQLFVVEPRIVQDAAVIRGKGGRRPSFSDQIKVDENKLISVDGENLQCNQLFQFVSGELKIPYHQMKQLDGSKSLSLNKVDFNTFMNAIVSATSQTYKFQDGILFLGDRNRKEMKTTQLVTFNYRRVDSLTQMLPRNIFQDIEIKEFPELNGLIVIGDADVLDGVVPFLKTIDVAVPVVLIDVIIVDVSNTEELETGIEAGVLKSSDDAVESGGTINPGIDYALNSTSINNAISKLGLTKLGKVTPNFYLALKALETNGIVDIRSTPQLSTLNGHAATMSIGETQYYKESSSLYQGSLTTQVETSIQYSPIEAKLGISIEPFVNGSGDVTLNIEVEQSSFSTSYEDEGPPGVIARKFKSMIRVKNQEMVLLGGLEELDKEKSSSGLPFLARVPVFSWFFSHKTAKDNKSRLNIFIKPTILY